MKPIINPWIVYVAGRCDVVRSLSIMMLLFSSIVVVIWCVECLFSETKPILSRWVKITVLISGLLTIFVPDKTTILTMATLNYVTTDNVEIAAGTVTDVIDYVTDKIEGILEEDK